MLLHPEVGIYTSIIHPQFNFEEGERIDFFCPICMSSLDASLNENLVQVIVVDSKGQESEVFFSRITGEKSTYRVSSEGVMVNGVHSYRYTHFKMTDEHSSFLQN